MTAFGRDEMEEMVRRWLAANQESGRTGDWSKMSAFHAEVRSRCPGNGA